MQVFFGYKKYSKTREFTVENMYYKILILEHFMACSLFLKEINSLSHNGIRGYLLVDRNLNDEDKKNFSNLLCYCQKRASIMLQDRIFRAYMSNDRLMGDEDASKRLQNASKLVNNLEDFRNNYFNFGIKGSATTAIIDYRYTFFSVYATSVVCYCTLLCSFTPTMTNGELYECINLLKTLEKILTFISTGVSLMVSEEASNRIPHIDISHNLVDSLEVIYYSKCNDSISNEKVSDAYNSVLDIGLRTVSKHKITKDLEKFNNLQKFILHKLTFKNLESPKYSPNPEPRQKFIDSSTGGSNNNNLSNPNSNSKESSPTSKEP